MIGTTRADGAQETPTQSYISPSILVYEGDTTDTKREGSRIVLSLKFPPVRESPNGRLNRAFPGANPALLNQRGGTSPARITQQVPPLHLASSDRVYQHNIKFVNLIILAFPAGGTCAL